jgi:hypothetical protein
MQVSVNATTVPAENQEAVLALGRALPSLLRFMFDAPPTWEIEWQTVDLSDGFWRMIVQRGAEHNFVFQMPPRDGDRERYYVIPASLQMGWKNSPPYFCTATEITKKLTIRLLALTRAEGSMAPHDLDEYWRKVGAPTATMEGPIPEGAMVALQVFVDDFMNGITCPPEDEEGRARLRQWVGRAAFHAIHGVFPPTWPVHKEMQERGRPFRVHEGHARFPPPRQGEQGPTRGTG